MKLAPAYDTYVCNGKLCIHYNCKKFCFVAAVKDTLNRFTFASIKTKTSRWCSFAFIPKYLTKWTCLRHHTSYTFVVMGNCAYMYVIIIHKQFCLNVHLYRHYFFEQTLLKITIIHSGKSVFLQTLDVIFDIIIFPKFQVITGYSYVITQISTSN